MGLIIYIGIDLFPTVSNAKAYGAFITVFNEWGLGVLSGDIDLIEKQFPILAI